MNSKFSRGLAIVALLLFAVAVWLQVRTHFFIDDMPPVAEIVLSFVSPIFAFAMAAIFATRGKDFVSTAGAVIFFVSGVVLLFDRSINTHGCMVFENTAACVWNRESQ